MPGHKAAKSCILRVMPENCSKSPFIAEHEQQSVVTKHPPRPTTHLDRTRASSHTASLKRQNALAIRFGLFEKTLHHAKYAGAMQNTCYNMPAMRAGRSREGKAPHEESPGFLRQDAG